MFVDSDDLLEPDAINSLLTKAYISDYDMGKDIQSILFKDVKFPENYWFENTVIGSVTHARAKSMANISQSVYRYLINVSSTKIIER